jgi:hypothetical protein
MARRPGAALRGGVTAAVSTAILLTATGVAAADATDDYPIPNRILRTSCTAEQIMAAARTTDICAEYPADDQGVWNW